MIMLKHSEQLARHYVGSLISSKVSETKAQNLFACRVIQLRFANLNENQAKADVIIRQWQLAGRIRQTHTQGEGGLDRAYI